MPSKKWSMGTVALSVLLVGAPGALEAQDRRADADWWRWAVAELLVGEDVWTTQGRRVRIGPHDHHRRDRVRRSRRGGEAGGPAFCRSGQGHPVFGRRWCLDKGFGLDRARWRRGDIGDIIFRRSPRRHGSILDRMGLEEILGDIILGRLLEGAGVHHRAPVTGRWLRLDDAGARVLQLRSDSRPLAELSDVDRDAVVDVLLWSDMEP